MMGWRGLRNMLWVLYWSERIATGSLPSFFLFLWCLALLPLWFQLVGGPEFTPSIAALQPCTFAVFLQRREETFSFQVDGMKSHLHQCWSWRVEDQAHVDGKKSNFRYCRSLRSWRSRSSVSSTMIDYKDKKVFSDINGLTSQIVKIKRFQS